MRRGPAPSPEVILLLELRAERLKQAAQADPEESQAWIAEVPVGDETYGIPLERLRGAMRGARVTPVPLAPPEVAGIFRFRGEMYTALSLPALLGGTAAPGDPNILLVVDAGDGRGVGLGCDDVPRLVGVPESAAGEPSLHAAAAVRTLSLPGRRPVNLVDLPRLLARAEVRGA